MGNNRIWEITEGLVASDGHVTKKCFLTLNTTHKEYAKQVHELYRSEGFKTYFGRTRGEGFGVKRTMYRVEVYNKKFFGEFRERWYDEKGKKRLPDDFEITPLVLNALYCGDGYLRVGAHGYPEAIWLYTMCFGEDENQRIVDQLRGIGIESVVWIYEGKAMVKVLPEWVNDFLQYIGEPVFKCFRYKWQLRPLDANTQEGPRISVAPEVLAQAVEQGKLVMYKHESPAQNPAYEMVLYVPQQFRSALGEKVKGRKLKRVLERCLDLLSDKKKELATVFLAMPIGRRRQDIKSKIYQRYLEISGSPEETERGGNSGSTELMRQSIASGTSTT